MMGTFKTKTIQADLGIFTHIPAYSSIFIIRLIQELFRHIQNPVKPWHVQNPGMFSTLAYSEA